MHHRGLELGQAHWQCSFQAKAGITTGSWENLGSNCGLEDWQIMLCKPSECFQSTANLTIVREQTRARMSKECAVVIIEGSYAVSITACLETFFGQSVVKASPKHQYSVAQLWGFPKMAATPSHHPFHVRIFHDFQKKFSAIQQGTFLGNLPAGLPGS